jgi:hypothetical protein
MKVGIVKMVKNNDDGEESALIMVGKKEFDITL